MKIRIQVLSALVLLTLGLAACGGGKPTPRLQVTIKADETVTAGDSLAVEAVIRGATGNPTVSWTAEAGTFANPEAITTSWTAPADEGKYVLSVSVSGATGQSAEATLEVTVTRAQPDPPGEGGETPEPGSPPEPLAISVNLAQVDAVIGDTVPLTVIINEPWNSAEGLSITWSAVASPSPEETGEWTATDGRTTEWIAPAAPGTYRLQVHVESTVSGELADASKQVEIHVATACSGGHWEGPEPCVLTNITQLQELMLDHPAGHFRLGNDIDAGRTASWNDGKGFRPIGQPPAGHDPDTSWPEGLIFTGTLDGNGRTISGLVINRPDEAYTGLFGVIHSSPDGYQGPEDKYPVRNLTLTGTSIAGGNYTGTLAGVVDGVVGDILVTDSRIEASPGSEYVGGAVGYNDAGELYGVDVLGVAMEAPAGKYLGGHTGHNDDGTIEGSVKDVGITAHGGSYIGGYTGYLTEDTTEGMSVSRVTISALGGRYVGGHTGAVDTYATLLDSPAHDIQIDAAGGENIGGHTGLVTGSSEINSSPVTAVVINARRSENVGGHTGLLAGSDIRDSLATGVKITAANGRHVGGLAGKSSDALIARSFTAGGNDIQGGSSVGGLVGTVLDGEVTDSYAIQARISGTADTGGLVGLLASDAEITNTYTTNLVATPEPHGHLVGRNEGTPANNVEASFYLSEDAPAAGSSGLPLLPGQFREAARFTDAGWDLAGTWHMPAAGSGSGNGPEDIDYGSPDLQENSRFAD